MSPEFFTPKDIQIHPCKKCGKDIEFWKDDVKITCTGCGTINFNPGLGTTCLAWCKQADKCLGNNDIDEWKKKKSSQEQDPHS
jgi:hypothetical protein